MSTGTRIILKKGSGEPDPLDLAIAELAVDVVNGDLYTKLQSSEVKNLTSGVDGGTGSSVHIGDEPANPQEGQQWMEIPDSGDATMWIYDGDKWLEEPSGSSGGGDSLWTDNGGSISYSAGNVGIGASPRSVLDVVSGSGEAALLVDSRATDDEVSRLSLLTKASGSNSGGMIQSSGGSLSISASTNLETKHLTIDTTGNATFSSEVRSNISGGAVRINPTDQSATSPHMRFWGNSGGGWYNVGRSTADGTFQINVGANFDSPSNNALTIDTTGDAQFSGTVDANGMRIGGNLIYNNSATGHGIRFNTVEDNILPVDNAGNLRSVGASLGNTSRRFKDGYFSGNLYKNGSTSPLINAQELIETLSTLRDATKDETTIKGLRDAIGNAVGGLIEKFEAMQEVATQEITDE